MLIVGAKGFAKEVLEVLNQLDDIKGLVFYDDINKDMPSHLYSKFPILKTLEEAEHYFKFEDVRFTIGIGNPVLRKQLYDTFSLMGGVFESTISPKAIIGSFGNYIEIGCNIMSGSVLTNDVQIGIGSLINLNCTIGHDSIIGDFVEMSPVVHISGNCQISSYTSIGTNATILPRISVGKNVIVGAGAVVTKNISDNCMVAGVPAKIIKELTPLMF